LNPSRKPTEKTTANEMFTQRAAPKSGISISFTNLTSHLLRILKVLSPILGPEAG